MSGKGLRYERMIRALRLTIGVAFIGALVGTVVPGDVGRVASVAAVGVIVAAPLVRVAWLTYRWYRWGDRGFASLAALLLLVVGAGTAIAALTR